MWLRQIPPRGSLILGINVTLPAFLFTLKDLRTSKLDFKQVSLFVYWGPFYLTTTAVPGGTYIFVHSLRSKLTLLVSIIYREFIYFYTGALKAPESLKIISFNCNEK